MITEDYIMRQVAMLSQILARLLGLRRAAQHEAALAETEDALYQLLGMSSALVAALPPEDLVAMLCRDTTRAAGRERCALLVACLHERAVDLGALSRGEESRVFQVKALQVLLALDANGGETPVPDRAPPLATVTAGLQAADVPRAVYPTWLGALEHCGVYAKVEDLLFEMLAAEPGDAELFAWGGEFYTRLERKSDAELAAGNLPREEIAAGRAALRERTPGNRA